MALKILRQRFHGQRGPAAQGSPPSSPQADAPRDVVPPTLLAYLITALSHKRKAVRKAALSYLKELAEMPCCLADALPHLSVDELGDLAVAILEQVLLLRGPSHISSSTVAFCNVAFCLSGHKAMICKTFLRTVVWKPWDGAVKG
jgi:hypothetical protein